MSRIKEDSKNESNISKTRLVVYIIILSIIAGTGMYLHSFGFFKTECGLNKLCFNDKLEDCSAARLIHAKNGNYYSYEIEGWRDDTCLVEIKLVRVAPGTSLKLKSAFEGKDMSCNLPEDKLKNADIEDINNFINYCHGTLKEAIYEHMLSKIYGLVLQNLDAILTEEEI